jgi:hypothetical protein
MTNGVLITGGTGLIDRTTASEVPLVAKRDKTIVQELGEMRA